MIGGRRLPRTRISATEVKAMLFQLAFFVAAGEVSCSCWAGSGLRHDGLSERTSTFQKVSLSLDELRTVPLELELAWTKCRCPRYLVATRTSQDPVKHGPRWAAAGRAAASARTCPGKRQGEDFTASDGQALTTALLRRIRLSTGATKT